MYLTFRKQLPEGCTMKLCGIDWSTISPVVKQKVQIRPRKDFVWARVFHVSSVKGAKIEVWKILEGSKDDKYNCHGLSLETHKVPGGPYWISNPEAAIVHGFRRLSFRDKVQPNDLALWWEPKEEYITHTARILSVGYIKDGINAETTLVHHKNGAHPLIKSIVMSELVNEFLKCNWQIWRSNNVFP